MLVIEGLPCWDVDQLAGIRRVRENPLWWKPKEEKSLRERLDVRVDREKAKKRVPQKA